MRGLWVASLVAETLLLGHLYMQRLIGRYPFFASYITLDVIAGALLVQFDISGTEFASGFHVYASINIFLRCCICLELYLKLCAHFPGMGSFRYWIAGAAGAGALLLAVVSFRPYLCAVWGFPTGLVLVARHYVSALAALGLTLVWLFFRYILPLSEIVRPNVILHWKILIAYFSIGAMHDAVILAHIADVFLLDCFMFLGEIICLTVWLSGMFAHGELAPDPLRRKLSSEELAEIERQYQEFVLFVTELPRQIKRNRELDSGRRD